MLQHYLISIDARLRSRKSTVPVKAETAECLIARNKKHNKQNPKKSVEFTKGIFSTRNLSLSV